MKSSNIGGQAVLEGIMMRHGDDYAVAVRKPDGEIFVQKEEYHSVIKWISASLHRSISRGSTTMSLAPRCTA